MGEAVKTQRRKATKVSGASSSAPTERTALEGKVRRHLYGDHR
jgi:hypothetical protein